MATLAGRPTSTYRLRASAPAAPLHWKTAEPWPERPGVAQFVYLSALLHAIAILLFGAPPGGSRDGRAMWGSLNVQIVAPAAPITIPAPMAPIVAAPPLKMDRTFVPPRNVVTPQVVVPPKIDRISPPQMTMERMLPAPKIEVVPAPVPPPPVAVPRPIAPIVPHLPQVERTMVEPPKIEAPLPPVEVPRIETPLVPAVPAAPSLPAIERVPEMIVPKIAPAPTVVEPVAPPKVEAPSKVEAPPVAKPDAPASREELFAPRAPAPAAPAPPRPPVPERRATEGDYDPTKPAPSMDEMRRRASQLAREGSGQRALLPFPMPAVPERKTKTEEALDKARKPDCRTAYKDLGLLAAVPLLANEFGEGTCRW